MFAWPRQPDHGGGDGQQQPAHGPPRRLSAPGPTYRLVGGGRRYLRVRPRQRRSRQTAMFAMELHRHAIHRGEALQAFCRNGVVRAIIATVGVQYGDATPIGMLELVQAATRLQVEDSVEVEKIGLTRHVLLPLDAGGRVAGERRDASTSTGAGYGKRAARRPVAANLSASLPVVDRPMPAITGLGAAEWGKSGDACAEPGRRRVLAGRQLFQRAQGRAQPQQPSLLDLALELAHAVL